MSTFALLIARRRCFHRALGTTNGGNSGASGLIESVLAKAERDLKTHLDTSTTSSIRRKTSQFLQQPGRRFLKVSNVALSCSRADIVRLMAPFGVPEEHCLCSTRMRNTDSSTWYVCVDQEEVAERAQLELSGQALAFRPVTVSPATLGELQAEAVSQEMVNFDELTRTVTVRPAAGRLQKGSKGSLTKLFSAYSPTKMLMNGEIAAVVCKTKADAERAVRDLDSEYVERVKVRLCLA